MCEKPRRLLTSTLDGMKYLALLAMLLVGSTHAACLDYREIEIHGVLVAATLPGPPNYESIEAGDERETYFFVKLSKPTCVTKGIGALEPSVQKIQKIQLIFDLQAAQDSYDQLRPSLRKRVSCKGVLLGMHTGHHHSDVVLSEAKCHAI